MPEPSRNALKSKLTLALRLRGSLVRMLTSAKLGPSRRRRVQERIEILDREIAILRAKLTPDGPVERFSN
jgi:hypothetical protein